MRVFIIERPFGNHIAGFVQNADFAGNSWIRRDWLRFINALYEVVPDDALRQSFKADAVTFGGQNEVRGIPLEEVYKISHIGRLTLGVGSKPAAFYLKRNSPNGRKRSEHSSYEINTPKTKNRPSRGHETLTGPEKGGRVGGPRQA